MARAVLAILLLLLGIVCRPAAAQDLLADISQSVIEIRYSFAGADLLLFGAINRPGGGPDVVRDVVVVVKGPAVPTVVRRKERVAGIWINTDSLTYDAPGYYAVASTRPLADITSDLVLRRQEIGFDKVRLFFNTTLPNEEQVPFRRAFIRKKQEAGLYRQAIGSVTLVDGALFRTDLTLPATVPVGAYNAEIYLFENGALVAQRTQPVIVDKSGFERAVFTFAHEQPFLYGLLAVVIALAAGWVAGTVAKK